MPTPFRAAGLVLAVFVAAALCLGVFVSLQAAAAGGDTCGAAVSPPSSGIVLGPAGPGQTVGASEYGGPGDPSSGVIGSSGVNLLQEPDSYAELGGSTFATATAMGGLPYGTPLRISWGGHSAIAYKRDIGLGGGPIDGLPRVIDLWWQFAARLGIPYEDGEWSGPVRVARTPSTGAAAQLGDLPASAGSGGESDAGASAACVDGLGGSGAGLGAPVVAGERAVLLPDGQAAAPADAPLAVKEMIAAGNQIVGKPYVYGGGHGLPLSAIAPSYDCSSSVEHILYGAGLIPVDDTVSSATLESFGLPGPGRWVTLYASADHVFMYVAGLRWDTHNAAGPDDGSTGIGWHPLVREADGFVARHPAGL